MKVSDRWFCGLLTAVATVVLIGPWTGCVRLSTDPIRIEPISIEVTINHRIQRELEDIFGSIDQASDTVEYEPLEDEEEEEVE